jgi:release factor glutamine methyltransferase
MRTEFEQLASTDITSETSLILPNGQELKLSLTSDFPISPYTRFFLYDLPEFAGYRVLDFGTGSGVLALAAAKLGASSVVASDISSDAILLATSNAKANGEEGISLIRHDKGSIDVLSSRTFDLIICNPASLPTPPHIPDAFWSGGRLGLDMIFQLIELSSRCLSRSGRLRFIHTSLAPLHSTLSYLATHGFSTGILRVQEIQFRPFYAELFSHFVFIRNHHGGFFTRRNGLHYEFLYLLEAHRADECA